MFGNKTRVIHLADSEERDAAENTRTRIVLFDQQAMPTSFRSLFIRNFDIIRKTYTRFRRHGLAIIAIDGYSGAFRGSMCLAAKEGRANAAIIGRHSMADLYLPDDESLSLRHLAVLIAPLRSYETEVEFRLIDLRTASAFYDEQNQLYEALIAEGPLFVRCGSYVLFLLPTTDRPDWPEEAKDAWDCIPERVYIAERAAEPDRWKRKRARPRRAHTSSRGDGSVSITRVSSIAGPVSLRDQMLIDGESALGTLRVTTPSGAQALVIGPDTAARGVLLGRYNRCDIDASHLLTDDMISRVHALVIQIGKQLYTVDTASTHGTWLAGDSRRIHVEALHPETSFVLGDDLARIRWTPAG